MFATMWTNAERVDFIHGGSEAGVVDLSPLWPARAAADHHCYRRYQRHARDRGRVRESRLRALFGLLARPPRLDVTVV
jgi:hypothetical protein